MSKTDNRKVVLYSILHWGLGHATRSIPIIEGLQRKGYEVIVCTDGKVVDFIKKELPGIDVELLPGYNIRYSSPSMVRNMLRQLPKIYSTYIFEKALFKRLVKKHNPIFCISDNRYGCRSKNTINFFLGHQWNILDSKGHKHKIASRLNQMFISKFHRMIIPDTESQDFSGKLSKGVPKDFGIFSGILSRFVKTNFYTSQAKYEAAIILSGPEPSRTNLELRMISILSEIRDKQFVLIRGTNKNMAKVEADNIEILDLVTTGKLSNIINQSRSIVSRSGYSSVMDYVRMGVQNLVFIPTIGQTEQEYLASYYQEKHGILSVKENELHLLKETLNKVTRSPLIEGQSLGINGLIDQLEKLVPNPS